MANAHPIVKMLSWKSRLLSEADIEAVLAAVANIKQQRFTLTELTELLPPAVVGDRKKRRSISSLLTNLVSIGYLSKPSERKWAKNTNSLSHYLSPLLLELSQIERKPFTLQEKKLVNITERVG